MHNKSLHTKEKKSEKAIRIMAYITLAVGLVITALSAYHLIFIETYIYGEADNYDITVTREFWLPGLIITLFLLFVTLLAYFAFRKK